MHPLKHISNFFTMMIDKKDDVVVIPRDYKGSPILAYSPKILITTERIYNKYWNEIKCDPTVTKVIFLEE